MKFTHGICAALWTVNEEWPMGQLAIVHFVGFEEEPDESDYESLRQELATDSEFGLLEHADKLTYFPAPGPVLAHYQRAVDGGMPPGMKGRENEGVEVRDEEER